MSNTDLNIPLKVKELRKETADYLSIIYETPRDFIFTPGMWMDIRFISEELSIGRTFSFASSPTEPDLTITFKKGVSRFKKSMENVKPGDTMLITQYGSNGFKLDKRTQSIFVAGGIGIVPFRSMIKNAIDFNEKLDVLVIYLNRTDDFPFKKDLDEWQAISRHLKIKYLITEEEGRLNKEKIQEFYPSINNIKPMCYIAGPPGMVDNTKKIFLDLGIDGDNILIDRFEGY